MFLFVVFLASFGASNKDLLFINLWPFDSKLQIPTYLFFYISVIIGVLSVSTYYFFKKKNET
ncbi:MAG: hypothetical protein CBC22_04180 [Alphaproteobacteria bacterium TMED62]|nr:MAG: hypothetical protein CBC22_04180 [Alphaproteobacteria bacterium TMED62]